LREKLESFHSSLSSDEAMLLAAAFRRPVQQLTEDQVHGYSFASLTPVTPGARLNCHYAYVPSGLESQKLCFICGNTIISCGPSVAG
jgi:hypothetical protein